MPYILTFVKQLVIGNPDLYINDCCIGGDLVLQQLLPLLRKHYGDDLQAKQEDWGWYVWFKQSGVNLAIDVHTNDEQTGELQIHVTSRMPRLILAAKIHDTPELESLLKLILSSLETWPVAQLTVERVNDKYMPLWLQSNLEPRLKVQFLV